VPIGEAAHVRRDEGLERRGDEEAAGDHGRSGPELVEPQRAEHVERPEHQTRNRHQPHAAQHAPVARRFGEVAQPRDDGRCARRRAGRPRHQAEPDQADAAEHRLGPGRRGGGAQDRPEQRPDDRGAHRGADQLAAAVARRLADQPAQGPGPRERAAHPLDEPGDVEHRDAVREGERDAGGRHHPEAEQGRRPDAGAGRQPPAGQRAGEGPGRVGRRQHAGLGLREAEVVHVARQQRRDRGVERRVHEHDRGGEEQQAAHGRVTLATAGGA
jgi:hypothetical protein